MDLQQVCRNLDTPVRRSGDSGAWIVCEKIGSGAFGSVYVGHDCNGALIAIKVQQVPHGVNQHSQRLLLQEVQTLQRLQHPNVVTYLGSTVDEHNLYIFMSYEPQCLAKIIKLGLDERVVRNYTRQILLGLAYVHDLGIAHRDIKSANLLVGATGAVKLTDFGVAKVNRHQQEDSLGYSGFNTMVGSPHWMSPEVMQVAQSTGGYDGAKADIWSLGVTVIEMLTGANPWPGLDQMQVILEVVQNPAGPPRPSGASPLALDFLEACLQRDPAQRSTAVQLLEHPFVASTGTSDALVRCRFKPSGHLTSSASSASSTPPQLRPTPQPCALPSPRSFLRSLVTPSSPSHTNSSSLSASTLSAKLAPGIARIAAFTSSTTEHLYWHSTSSMDSGTGSDWDPSGNFSCTAQRFMYGSASSYQMRQSQNSSLGFWIPPRPSGKQSGKQVPQQSSPNCQPKTAAAGETGMAATIAKTPQQSVGTFPHLSCMPGSGCSEPLQGANGLSLPGGVRGEGGQGDSLASPRLVLTQERSCTEQFSRLGENSANDMQRIWLDINISEAAHMPEVANDTKGAGGVESCGVGVRDVTGTTHTTPLPPSADEGQHGSEVAQEPKTTGMALQFGWPLAVPHS